MSDRLKFIAEWAKNPLQVGAITPSSKKLADAMALLVDPASDLPVLELGPGTGVVTQALLDRGVAPSRIYSLEYNGTFAKALARKYPAINVVQGDAYALKDSLAASGVDQFSSVISSLPLFTVPVPQRISLLNQAIEMMVEDGKVIQFSYAWVPVVGKHRDAFNIWASKWIWLNVPPARVWTYGQAR